MCAKSWKTELVVKHQATWHILNKQVRNASFMQEGPIMSFLCMSAPFSRFKGNIVMLNKRMGTMKRSHSPHWHQVSFLVVYNKPLEWVAGNDLPRPFNLLWTSSAPLIIIRASNHTEGSGSRWFILALISVVVKLKPCY